jgi:hypothetical protein
MGNGKEPHVHFGEMCFETKTFRIVTVFQTTGNVPTFCTVRQCGVLMTRSQEKMICTFGFTAIHEESGRSQQM